MTRAAVACTSRACLLALLLATAAVADADDLPPADPAVAAPPEGVLAGIPLDTLRATRERPLFVPSRRAPEAPPPVAAVEPTTPPPPPAPMLAQEPPPRFTLLGIIRSPGQGSAAVVSDEADHTSFTLKPGADRHGWVLQSIAGNVVTLKNGERAMALTYPEPQSRPLAGAGPGAGAGAPSSQDDE